MQPAEERLPACAQPFLAVAAVAAFAACALIAAVALIAVAVVAVTAAPVRMSTGAGLQAAEVAA